jgi:hypothetical protein
MVYDMIGFVFVRLCDLSFKSKKDRCQYRGGPFMYRGFLIGWEIGKPVQKVKAAHCFNFTLSSDFVRK